jgi:DNA-binding transcriptional regulator YdaS (Cro superfamily)
LLEYAVERLGREALAARLKVQEALLAAWIEGRASMPDRKLGPLAEVIGGLADR